MITVAINGFPSPAATAAEEYQLYTPASTTASSPPADPAKGILTKTVTIQPGDTLSKISRAHSGRSSYFPQILLFNSIKNADKIRAGAQIRVPVTRVSVQEAKPGVRKGGVKGVSHRARKVVMKGDKPRHVRKGGGQASKAKADRQGKQTSTAEDELYARGVVLFKKGAYEKAAAVFEQFLSSYPGSRRAADAALYKADCYLKRANGTSR
jgi:TolA-binding protein